ncbi:MAG: hypothetical protein WB952_05755 [Terriglobales bacterium]
MKFRVMLMFLASVLVLSPASAQDSGAITHARGSVNIEQNQDYFVKLKWAVPFADTKYTVSCTPIVPAAWQTTGDGVYLFEIAQVAPTFVKVELAADVGEPGIVHIDCIAIHD